MGHVETVRSLSPEELRCKVLGRLEKQACRAAAVTSRIAENETSLRQSKDAIGSLFEGQKKFVVNGRDLFKRSRLYEDPQKAKESRLRCVLRAYKKGEISEEVLQAYSVSLDEVQANLESISQASKDLAKAKGSLRWRQFDVRNYGRWLAYMENRKDEKVVNWTIIAADTIRYQAACRERGVDGQELEKRVKQYGVPDSTSVHAVGELDDAGKIYITDRIEERYGKKIAQCLGYLNQTQAVIPQEFLAGRPGRTRLERDLLAMINEDRREAIRNQRERQNNELVGSIRKWRQEPKVTVLPDPTKVGLPYRVGQFARGFAASVLSFVT